MRKGVLASDNNVCNKKVSKRKIGIRTQFPYPQLLLPPLMQDKQKSYACIGDFKEDFVAMCTEEKLSYIPAVVPRHALDLSQEPSGSKSGNQTKKTKAQKGPETAKALWPTSTSRDREDLSPANDFHFLRTCGRQASQQDLTDKNNRSVPRKRNSLNHTASFSRLHSQTDLLRRSQSLVTDSTQVSAVPSNTTTTDSVSFFVPCIQVVKDNPRDAKTVTEIYIRGWKVDVAMMKILKRCLPALSQLCLLHMWNTALSDDTVSLMASFLPLCRNLTTLQLDGNSLAGVPLCCLLDAQSQVLHLSLRFCDLTHLEAHSLGTCLGQIGLSLLTLNLSCNKLGDPGARHLAEGLKTNRTLLTLNLTSNDIGDQGAQQLAVALSQYPANPRELRKRRQLVFHKLEKENIPLQLSQQRIKSKLIGSSNPKNREGKEQKEKAKTSSTSPKRSLVISRPNSPGLLKSTRPAKSRRKRLSDTETGENSSDFHEINPLTDEGMLGEDGKLYLPANHTLLSLNLSRNRIGETGFKSLLEALEFQACPRHNSHVQKPGLRRLELHHNSAPESCFSARKIRHCMRIRDPTFPSPRIDLQKVNITPCSIPRMF